MISTKTSLTLALPLALSLGQALAADDKPAVPALTAAQVVERNIAARGGLPAWHAIHAMAWSGKLEAGRGDSEQRSEAYVSTAMASRAKLKAAIMAESKEPPKEAKQIELPFVLDMKRPAKSRLEIDVAGQTAVQVYDGSRGWKLRPFLNRDDWEPFTSEELKASADKWQLDGPLLDAAADGTKVELEGMDKVDGSQAYKLKLALKDGTIEHVWVDAKSFLDVKVDGTPRRMDGKMRTVWIYQRDFRQVHGVMVPFVLETAVDGYRDTHKMRIDKVSVNPALGDALFTKPAGA